MRILLMCMICLRTVQKSIILYMKAKWFSLVCFVINVLREIQDPSDLAELKHLTELTSLLRTITCMALIALVVYYSI